MARGSGSPRSVGAATPGAAEFQTVETAELARLVRAEQVMVRIRWGGVAFGLAQVLTYYLPYPPGLFEVALGLAALLAVGNIVIWRVLPGIRTVRQARRLSVLALLLNGTVFVGLVFVYTFDTETAIWALLYVLPMEAAIRFQLRGAMVTIGVLTVIYTFREVVGTLVYGHPFLVVSITYRMGIGFIIASVAGVIAQSLTRDREQLAVLSGVTRTVATARNLREVLDGATRDLAELFRVRGAAIALFDRERLRLVLMAEHTTGTAPALPTGSEVPLTPGGPATEAVERRAAVAVHDVADVAMEPETRALLTGRGVEAFLLAPLLSRDDVIGMVLAETGERGRRFSPGELALAETVAGQLAAAIVSARLFEEAQEARAAADSANQAKSAFLATMSHEIRTPMNAVIGMTELLEATELSAQQREFTGVIARSGEGLLAIINDVLDFSKIEAGRLELTEEPFDVRGCVEGALDVLAPRAAERGLELACAIDPGVPAAVRGDAIRLRQILVNLLGNAVKFTDDGEVVASVRTTPAEGAVRLHIEVADTGIGIPEEQLGRLFRSFSQVDDSATRRHGGTGLGLAISRRLATLMGGGIEVRSTAGHGTTFTVTVLVRPADPAELPAPAPPAPPVAALAGRTALLVDDNATNLRILAAHCAAWGVRATATTSPHEALDRVRRGERFDLAVLDVRMPELDGVSLAALIRERGPAPAMVCLSSLGGSRAAAPGVDAWLAKPVKRHQLAGVLVGLLDPARQPRPAVAPAPELPELPELRILVAEDNPVNQQVAVAYLERLGQRADVVANGLEALDALDARPYDVALLDVQMPGLDGLETARRIVAGRPRERRPWLVALTANALQGDREACLAAGMDDYLAKPVRLAELARALRGVPTPAGAPDPAPVPVAAGAPEPTAVPVAGGETGGVDPGVLPALVDSFGDGGPQLVAELVETFVASVPALARNLHDGLATGDAGRVRMAAHALKSNARTFGATALAARCADLEARAADGLAGADPLVDAIVTRLPAWLRTLRALATPATGDQTARPQPVP